MTAERDLDFRLAAWLDERAASVVPEDLLARSLARVATVRQRPGWLVGGASVGKPVTLGRSAVPAWVVVIAIAVAAVAVLAIGTNLLTNVIVIEPSPTGGPTGAPASQLEPTTSPPTPGPLGGGLILAHTFARFGDPGPFEVVAIDAGTGQTTLLGKLPGEAVTGNSGPYTFERSADRARVVVFDRALQEPTAAAEPIGFASAVDLGRDCCPNEPMEWPELSPDGNRVAAVHADKFDNPIEIVVVDLTGHVLNRLPIPAAMNWSGPLAWAPDGRTLLMPGCRPCNKAETPTQKQTAHHDHLYLIPVDGSPWQEMLDVNNGGFSAKWSPDGTRLAVERFVCARGSFMPRCDPIEGTSDLNVLALADGVESPLGRTPGITGAAWSPDGTRIGYGDITGAYVVDVATANKTRLADDQSFGVHWSPDGQWLIVDRSNGDNFDQYAIWIVRADASQLHQLVTGYAGATW